MVTRENMNRRLAMDMPLPADRLRWLLYLVTAGLAVTALYVVFSSAVGWGQVQFDDLRYGNPRTFHLTADVGHGGGTGAASHLIALNLDRQVMVIDIPGGDIEQMRALPGPYLFGAGENLTPVTMHLDDVNADEHVDLVVNVKDEQIVYINRDEAFQLVSPAERQQLVQQRDGQ